MLHLPVRGEVSDVMRPALRVQEYKMMQWIKIAFSLLDFMIQQMYFKLSLAGLVFVIFS